MTAEVKQVGEAIKPIQDIKNKAQKVAAKIEGALASLDQSLDNANGFADDCASLSRDLNSLLGMSNSSAATRQEMAQEEQQQPATTPITPARPLEPGDPSKIPAGGYTTRNTAYPPKPEGGRT